MNNQNEEYKNLISYATFLKDRNNFRKSGTRSGSEFNRYESPVNLYFKILFYFQNGDVDHNTGLGNSGGFLAPTWANYTNASKYYDFNSAWSYLKMNGEEERAEKLEKFITLLSNISTEAPWTFSSISGLDQALERSAGQNKEFKVDEERKKISIKCMPDSFDTRVGTLLDLYRDIAWQTKREVIPSNLRKFDMGIFIFSDTIKNIHTPREGEEASLLNNTSGYLSSYKYIEFHNCEFDYNSAKSAYGEMSNAEGFSPEYTIDIYFDDAYEQRYNEFMMRVIGDMIQGDYGAESTKQEDNQDRMDKLSERLNAYGSDGFLSNVTSQLIGAGKSFVENKLKSLFLGNLYEISPKTALTQIKGAAAGNVFSTASAIDDYIEHVNDKKSKSVGNLGNLFKGKSMSKNI